MNRQKQGKRDRQRVLGLQLKLLKNIKREKILGNFSVKDLQFLFSFISFLNLCLGCVPHWIKTKVSNSNSLPYNNHQNDSYYFLSVTQSDIFTIAPS